MTNRWNRWKGAALGCAAAALTIAGAMPAQAIAGASARSEAEQLRKLDIMLMVTGLRCRTTAHDFRADFAAFEAAHLRDLNDAAAELRQGLVASAGVAGAARALDRISTGMANQYGQGHPWLDCAQLKQATKALTRVKGRAILVEAADQLLAPQAGSQLAFVER